LLAPLASGASVAAESLENYAQPNVRDIRATVLVDKKSDDALREIGKDEPKGYGIKRSQFSLKEPDKVRVEGKYGLISILYVINGDRKMRSTLGVRKVKNIATRPGERYTALDLGILTPQVVNRLESRFLRFETRGTKKLPVFEVRFKGEPGGARPNILTIDPTTRTVVEHQVFHRKGGLKMRYVFRNLVRYADGVWLPSRVELYSPSGKLGATSQYVDVTVNGGLSDSLFQF
jgi:outer membrane lipoprotein-sorting protein